MMADGTIVLVRDGDALPFGTAFALPFGTAFALPLCFGAAFGTAFVFRLCPWHCLSALPFLALSFPPAVFLPKADALFSWCRSRAAVNPQSTQQT